MNDATSLGATCRHDGEDALEPIPPATNARMRHVLPDRAWTVNVQQRAARAECIEVFRATVTNIRAVVLELRASPTNSNLPYDTSVGLQIQSESVDTRP
jgi:hypothetical protein